MKLRFKLNHFFQGQNAPFLHAADAGLFARAGIDVSFVEGFSSSQVTRALLEDEADCGFGDVSSVLEHAIRTKTTPIAALMPIYVRSPCAIGYQRRASPLQLSELEGAVLCAPKGDTSARLLPLLLERNGLGGLDYSMLEVSPEERDRLVAERAVLGATCFDATLKFAMPMRGYDSDKIDFLYFADHGLDTYSSAFILKRSVLDEHPGLGAALIAIVETAWSACRAEPALGVAAVLARSPLLDPALVEAQLDWVMTHQVYHPSQPPFTFLLDGQRWADTVDVAAFAVTGKSVSSAVTQVLAQQIVG